MGTKIEWTERTWHWKIAAKRIGVSESEYQSRIELGQKWCTQCKKWHKREVFAKDKSRGDGLKSSCDGRIYNLYKQDQLFAEYDKKEHRNRRYREYYSKNKEDIRQRIYARKRNLDPIPGWWRQQELENKCVYCGGKAETLDHVIPVKHGGKSEPCNLVPACKSCNSSKKDNNPTTWIEKMDLGMLEVLMSDKMQGENLLRRLEEVYGYNKY